MIGACESASRLACEHPLVAGLGALAFVAVVTAIVCVAAVLAAGDRD